MKTASAVNRSRSRNSLDGRIQRYLDYLVLVAGRSTNTLLAYRRDLAQYAAYCTDVGISKPDAMTPLKIGDFIAGRTAAGMSPASIARCLSSVRNFHRYLVQHDGASHNPAKPIKTPRVPRKLPDVLSVRQMQQLLQAPDPQSKHGIRDRAVLAAMYGCGLRVSEAAELIVSDIDFDSGFVRVHGKGGRERLVPFGALTSSAVRRYLDTPTRRDAELKGKDFVFLSQKSGHLTRAGIWLLVRRYAIQSGCGERVHPHTFRHSFATHLVEAGADLRAVQMMLGHQSVATTQIYTHLDRRHLLQVHRDYHPLEVGFERRK